jgi:RNA polymerase sigma-70 factor (ECF subfamily)
LARVTTSAAEVAEVAQIVREKLLVPGAAGRARILDTAGHGDLGGLVRVIAIRTALNLRRAEQRQDPLEDHAELATLAPESDPELAAIQPAPRPTGRAEAALAGLEPRQLSAAHLVRADRRSPRPASTAPRRRAGSSTCAMSRAATCASCRPAGGDADGVTSLIRVLDSRLQVSFQRLLATGP